MNRLINIGFISVGNWYLSDSGIKFNLTSHHATRNILYSFISNGLVKYIGKTSRQLNQRMNGYQNPRLTQTTNLRVNQAIKNLLAQNEPIDIFILVDNGLLKYGDFKINLAAGLEDTLIYEINPEWNLIGKNFASIENKEDLEVKSKKTEKPVFQPRTLKTIEIKLGQAYYNQGFFNINKVNSGQFGYDKSTIEIQLGNNPTNTIYGYINRTANTNGTPRIMGGKELKNWIQNNFKYNEIMRVDIFSPVSIQVYKTK